MSGGKAKVKDLEELLAEGGCVWNICGTHISSPLHTATAAAFLPSKEGRNLRTSARVHASRA